MAYSQERENISKRKQRKEITDAIHVPNSDKSDKERAALALKAMKNLETERKDSLIAVRIDSKTTIYATPERAEYLIDQLSKDPIRRGGAYSRTMNI